MEKMLNVGIMLVFVLTLVPVSAFSADHSLSGSFSPVRELGSQELAAVRGGLSGSSGGGGKSGGGSQVTSVKRVVYPEVPHVYQIIDYNSRSNNYCGFAVASMLKYWVDYSKPSRFFQEQRLEELDTKALLGDFGWPINVEVNNGFLYSDSFDDQVNWWRSIDAASNLFCARDNWNKVIFTVTPEDHDPSTGLTTAWKRIHDYDDTQSSNRIPTIIVTKTSSTTLHYNLIVGTEKTGSVESFLVNDPWYDQSSPRSFSRLELNDAMSIPLGQYGWVGSQMDGKGVFAF